MKKLSASASCTAAAVFLFAAVACNQHHSDQPEADAGKVEFVRDIKPLLTSTCVICHHSETMLGGLNLETRKTAFGGSDGRAFIVPGEPDSSLLYLVTENPHGRIAAQEKMPAMEDIFLSDEERDLLRRWIEQGAEWPTGEDGWVQPIKVDLKRG